MNKNDEGCLGWIGQMLFMAYVIWSIASIDRQLRHIDLVIDRIERNQNR